MIIPHGGYEVPEELAEGAALDDLQIFIEADTCANEIFDMRNVVSATIDLHISRFFVDPDRSYLNIPPKDTDGVVKTISLQGNHVFKKGYRPDEIAISAILKRYYFPFFSTVDKILETGNIALIIVAHTVMPIGPKKSADYDRPRPIASVENTADINGKTIKTCSDEMAAAFLKAIASEFSKDGANIKDPFVLKEVPTKGHIMGKYSKSGVPILKLNLSKALFLDDKYFDPDHLTVDKKRLANINLKLEKAIARFSRAILTS